MLPTQFWHTVFSFAAWKVISILHSQLGHTSRFARAQCKVTEAPAGAVGNTWGSDAMKRRGARRRGRSSTSQVRQNTPTNSFRGISARAKYSSIKKGNATYRWILKRRRQQMEFS
jgi:hypothetical protein